MTLAIGLDKCPTCGRRALFMEFREGLHEESCIACGHIRRGSEVAEGQGVVAIFTHAGGTLYSRRPTARDLAEYDALREAGALNEEESYITICAAGNVYAVRGELP